MNLQDRAMLVNLSIRTWTSAKYDAKITAEVASANNMADASMGRYNKQLVCKSAVKELTRIKGAARTEHYKRTLPWGDDGFRVLSSIGYLEYADVMRRYESEWTPAVRDFVRGYPDFVRDAERALNGGFRWSDYPSVDKIAARFSFGFNVTPLSTAADFRVDLGTLETERIKAMIEDNYKAMIEVSMADVWDRLKNSIGHLVERLKLYSVTPDSKVVNPFRDTIVENIRDLIKLLPSLNITGNSDITYFAQRIDAELLNHNAETLRDSTWAREETVIAAQDILDAIGEFI